MNTPHLSTDDPAAAGAADSGGEARDPTAMLAGLRLSRDEPELRRRAWMGWLVLIAAVIGAGAGLVLWPDPMVEIKSIGAGDASPPLDLPQPADQPETSAMRPQAQAQAHADAGPVTERPPASTAGKGSATVLDATGYVVARRQATVSAKTTGKVREILVEEGMSVEEGQVIARLDDSVEGAQLELAQAQLVAAGAATQALEVELAHARRMLERAGTLARRDLLSPAELDDRRLAKDILEARLERARRDVAVAQAQMTVQQQRLEDFVIRAPFRGVVIDKAAQPGEMVSPISAGGGYTRTGIGTIVDMDSLEVEVDVNESYISRVGAGQAARVILNAYPDRAYAAEVLAIVPAADRSRATVSVRVAFLEIDERVLPEMGTRVAFLNHEPPQERTGP